MARVRKSTDIRSNALDKQTEKEKRQKVYSTEVINNILKDKTGKQDLNPFWHGQMQYRDAGIIFDYTDEERNVLEHCSMDCLYFVKHYAKFKNDKGHTLVKLREYQERLIHLYGSEKWDTVSETIVPAYPKIIVMSSRQSGKTTTTAAYFVWFLIFHRDKTSLVTANKATTGQEIISKIKDVLEGLPFFMKPGIINLSSNKIKFENGSSLKAAAASKTPATGDSIQLLYVDEAAVIAPNIIDEYWASIYPTMSSFRGAQIIMSSTPRGKGNLFYKIFSKAVPSDMADPEVIAETKQFVSTKVYWWEVPGRDEEWERAQREDLGDEIFNREFGLSFESNATRLVGSNYIQFMNRIKQEFKPIELYDTPPEIADKILWSPDFNPERLTYYELLHSAFLFVIDTAQGIEAGASGKKDADYNIINIFKIELLSPARIEKNRDHQHPINITDVVRYRQIGLYADNHKDEVQCAEAAKYIAFNILKTGFNDIDNVRILFERNFNGSNWLNQFMTHPSYYEAVIIKTPNGVNQPADGKIKYQYGFRTTTGKHGKNYYCELGEKMMRKHQTIIRQYNADPNISSITQLEQFGKNSKGAYEGTLIHDDISVTCLFLCIAPEQTMFQNWLLDWLEQQEPTAHTQIVQRMLEIYVEKEAAVSDEQFADFYRMSARSLGKLTTPLQSYSGLGQSNGGYGDGNSMYQNIQIQNYHKYNN